MAEIEGIYEYRSRSRDGEARYRLEIRRNGECALLTEFQVRDDGRRFEEDFGVLYERYGDRVVHEGRWSDDGGDRIKIRFERLRREDGSVRFEKMDVRADVERRGLRFRDWRRGLYGKRPAFSFRRTGDRFEDDSDLEGRYRASVYFDRDRREGLRYELRLRRSEAELTLERIGSFDARRELIEDYGRIVERLERRSRVTLTGRLERGRGDAIAIAFDRLRDDRYSEQIRIAMSGRVRGRLIEIDRFDREQFGRLSLRLER